MAWKWTSNIYKSYIDICVVNMFAYIYIHFNYIFICIYIYVGSHICNICMYIYKICVQRLVQTVGRWGRCQMFSGLGHSVPARMERCLLCVQSRSRPVGGKMWYWDIGIYTYIYGMFQAPGHCTKSLPQAQEYSHANVWVEVYWNQWCSKYELSTHF